MDLLAKEGASKHPLFDFKPYVAGKLHVRTGGIESGAQQFGAVVPKPWTEGRAGRRIAALTSLVSALLAREVPRLSRHG